MVIKHLVFRKLAEILFFLSFTIFSIVGGSLFLSSLFNWQGGLSMKSYFGAVLLCICGFPLGWYVFLKNTKDGDIALFSKSDTFDSQWRALFVIILTFVFAAIYISGSPLTGKAQIIFGNVYLSYALHGLAIAVASYFSYQVSGQVALSFFKARR